MVNSKQKGADWERKCCQQLSLWVSNKTREDVYWRSAMSGGRATSRSRRARRKGQLVAHAGDISATHEMGHALLAHFLIECKFYRDLKWDVLVNGDIGKSELIWLIPQRQAAEYGRCPMVIAKANMRQPLVLLDRAGRQLLLAGGGSLPVRVCFPGLGLYVSAFSDLLADVNFSELRKQWSRNRNPLSSTRSSTTGSSNFRLVSGSTS